MQQHSEIYYTLADDGTGDLLIGQSEDGEDTDEVRMTKSIALQLAWKILTLYTVEETNEV